MSSFLITPGIGLHKKLLTKAGQTRLFINKGITRSFSKYAESVPILEVPVPKDGSCLCSMGSVDVSLSDEIDRRQIYLIDSIESANER